MTAAPPVLPDEPTALRQFCLQLLAELTEQHQLVDKLRHELALLRRSVFGRRSEQLAPDQLLLEFGQWAAALNAAPPPAAPPAPPSSPAAPRRGHGRTPLPAFLPRQRIEHTLPPEQCTCQACGTPLVKIDEEISEQLDYRPAAFAVIEHVRFTYACQACEGTVATSPLPAQPIDKGRPGPGLLAQVITAKFGDHLPLHRQVDIFARHGVTLARQTLGDWMGASADLLVPLYADLRASALAGWALQTDDTAVPVLDRARTTTRAGHLWVYLRADGGPASVVFDYTPTHSRAGPAAFLRDYQGYLQADAYLGYDALYATGRIVEVGCWAHARRYFWKAKEVDPARALQALGLIKELYRVEALAKPLTPEARRALRAEQAAPVLTGFKTWLDAHARSVLPKSPIGVAIHYAREQWTALLRYLEHGGLAIDNNAAERALRAVCVGRNNWLFCGSDEGGRRAAILYTIVATCKALGIDPWAYLRDVLARIPTHPDRRRAELLPANWKAERALTSA
jgi:transposase